MATIGYDNKVGIISNPNAEVNKWTDANANEVKTVVNANAAAAEVAVNKDTDVTLASNSDVRYPSVKAVKTYIDNAALGIVSSWKIPVRVATTIAGTLASSFENGDTIDGVVIATADRILIKNQASAIENGIYTVNASGAPTRATDANQSAELEGAATSALEGTTNANTTWLQTTDGVNLGVSNLVWTQLGSSVSDADATTKGVARLYPSTSLGTNTDGAPTQNAVKVYADTALAFKLAIADFAKYILDQASADTTGATITLNMNSQVQRSFVGSASFSAAKAMALSNITNSLVFNFVYTVTNVTAVLTFPSEFQSKDPRWDSGANTWTPAEAGKYELGASFDGTNWIVKFFGAIN